MLQTLKNTGKDLLVSGMKLFLDMHTAAVFKPTHFGILLSLHFQCSTTFFGQIKVDPTSTLKT